MEDNDVCFTIYFSSTGLIACLGTLKFWTTIMSMRRLPREWTMWRMVVRADLFGILLLFQGRVVRVISRFPRSWYWLQSLSCIWMCVYLIPHLGISLLHLCENSAGVPMGTSEKVWGLAQGGDCLPLDHD
jgi:hypothetical protein